jgi:hypothetical protein
MISTDHVGQPNLSGNSWRLTMLFACCIIAAKSAAVNRGQMDYEKTIPFRGGTEKALEMARNIFIQQNFQIVASTDSAVELTGPGMLSSRQNPLVGLSSVTVRATYSSLSIEADFGAIQTLTSYLT